MGKRASFLHMLTISWMLLLAIILAQSGGSAAAASGGLANPGFEAGDLTGWTLDAAADSVAVVASDTFTLPYDGEYMLRLGSTASSRQQNQPAGSNRVYQEFIISEPELTFYYNVFTYDYAGYDQFSYRLVLVGTGEVILDHSQQAWGTVNDTSLKNTGWQTVNVDLSSYTGQTVRLIFDAAGTDATGGTDDELYATWAYIDLSETEGKLKIVETDNVTSVSEGGSADFLLLRLTEQPQSDVVVLISTADSQVEVDPLQVTFTPDNWNVAQTITVHAVDDAIYEGNHYGQIVFTLSSDDILFNGYTATVTVQISDNDSPVPDSFTIATAVSGGLGTITPSTTVLAGESVIITIQPANGYQIALFYDSGVLATDLIVDNTYTISDVDSNHNLYVTFAKIESNNAALSDLSLSAGTLTPEFSSEQIEYTSSVDYEVESIAITPIAEDDGATIMVDEESVDSGATSSSIMLEVGVSKTILIVVTAADGDTTKTYQIDVVRDIPDLDIVSVAPESNEPTNTEVGVLLDVSGEGTLIMKWLAGHVAESADMLENGETVENNRFVATANGEYTVYVADDYGNEQFAYVVISTIDREPPTLTLNGSEAVTHIAGTVYEDAGVTVNDNMDSPEQLIVHLEGEVNGDVPGTYTITYTAEDRAGNVSEPVSRAVTVVHPDVAAVQQTILSLLVPETISADLELPTADETNGTSIIWWSSNPDVLATDGTVNRPLYSLGDASVTLSATVSKGNVSEEAEFSVVVQRQPKYEAQVGLDGNSTFETGTGIALDFGSNDTAGAGLSIAEIGSEEIHIPDGMTPKGAIVNISLSGATLTGTVELTLPVTGDTTNVGIFYFNPATGEWEYQPSVSEGHSVTATLRHFSIYGVLEADRTAEVTASPVGGVAAGTEITLVSADAGATIYYTTDGSDPTTDSAVYDPHHKPVATSDFELKTFAAQVNRIDSPVNTYTYVIVKTGNPELSELVFYPNVTLDPEFSSEVSSYTTSVTNSVYAVAVYPVAVETDATIVLKIDGSPLASVTEAVYLQIGPNELEIEVTSQGGNSQSYTVTLTRMESDNAALSNLSLSDGTLTPEFSPELTKYTSSVEYEVESITITPVADDEGATITVDEESVDSGATSSSIMMEVGVSKTILIVVTAADGDTTKTYQINVVRDIPDLEIVSVALESNEPTNTEVGVLVDVNGEGTLTMRWLAGHVTESADMLENGAALTDSRFVASANGEYTVYVADDYGNEQFAYIIVNTIDREPPTLTLNGSEAVTHTAGTAYADAGVTASDNMDSPEQLTVHLEGSVNSDVPGTYTLTYTAEDRAGNVSEPVSRTVTVIPAIDPDVAAVQGTILSLQVPEMISADLELPTADETNGTSIVWWSSNPDVLATDGTVNRLLYSLGDASVTLSATVSKGDASEVAEFSVIVQRQPKYEAQAELDGESTFATGTGITLDFGANNTAGADLSITEVGLDEVDIPGGMTPKGAIVDISFSGASLTGTVELTLPVTGDTTNVGIFYFNPETGEWAYQPSVSAGNSVTATLRHFSTYGVLEAERTAEVTAAPVGGVAAGTEITLVSADADATIYYTTDGSEPTTDSAVYDPNHKPVATSDFELKTFAAQANRIDSPVNTYTYWIVKTGNPELSELIFYPNVTLHPEFSPEVSSYTTSVTNSVYAVAVYPIAVETDATIVLKINGVQLAGVTEAVHLQIGSNELEIEVTSQGGNSKLYTITLDRHGSTNADISSMTAGDHILTKTDDDGFMFLSQASASSVELQVHLSDPNARIISVTGAVYSSETHTITFNNLKFGLNTAVVTVVAEDETTVKSYTITVTRNIDFNGDGIITIADVIFGMFASLDFDGQNGFNREDVHAMLGQIQPRFVQTSDGVSD